MKSNEEILEEIHHAKSHSKSSKKIYKNAVKQYCKYNKLSLSRHTLEKPQTKKKTNKLPTGINKKLQKKYHTKLLQCNQIHLPLF